MHAIVPQNRDFFSTIAARTLATLRRLPAQPQKTASRQTPIRNAK